METILQDLRYAVRALGRQPGFAAIAVLTLAVGIGANTAIYSVVNATLLRPLPYKDPGRLMRVSLIMPSFHGRPPMDMVWSYPKYEAFHKLQTAFEDAALYQGCSFNLTGVGEPEQIRCELVSARYFHVLGISAEAGRTFLPEEDEVPERNMVAMISHNLWETRYGGRAGVVGQTITLSLKSYTIVGVVPASFQPLSGPADVWLPMHIQTARSLSFGQSHSSELVARLKRGVSAAQAKAEVIGLGPRIEEVHPDSRMKGWGAKATTLNEVRIDASIRTAVLVLFGAVSFVLLIACVNIANLLLARGSARGREIAIRLAVGASRPRLIRQLLTESVLLAVAGAAAGLAIAYTGVRALSIINPANGTALGMRMSGLTVLGLTSIRLDLNALLFTVVVALLTGVLFGLLPAWQNSRSSVTGSLHVAGPNPSGIGGLGLFSWRNLLVIIELALALVLLVGAGLLIKSFGRLMATRTGVDPDNVLTVRVNLPGSVPEPAAATFFQELENRVAALPGVRSVGMGDCPPLSGGCSGTGIDFRDRPPVTPGTEPGVGIYWVSPSYFRALRIPLLQGRWFSESDRLGGPKVVVISETAARRFWPGENALGHIVAVGQGGFGDRAEVVGIVGDVRYGYMNELPKPDVYICYLQSPRRGMMLNVRTNGNSATLTEAIRDQVHALDKDLPLYDIKTMYERIRQGTAKARFSATLLTVFAAMALILSAVGIYGVMAYLVTQRTREIGIRMALGARPSAVLSLVVRRSAVLAMIGIIVGILGALAVTRVLSTLLYGVRPDDTGTYATIGCGLLAVALAASYIPARRAAAVDPSLALRGD
jgi:putative ABC transport system permease protein